MTENPYKDARWQKKRLEALEAYGWTCHKCGSKGRGELLHVHHRYYVKGTEIWDIPVELLAILCENCHREVTTLKRDIASLLHDPVIFEAFKRFYVLAEFGIGTKGASEPIQSLSSLAAILGANIDLMSSMSHRYWTLARNLKEKFPEVAGALMPENQNADE